MKFKREIIAIILIICMLFTISAISAADSSADAVSATNATVEAANRDVDSDNNLAMENGGEILGETDDGSFYALNTKINAASIGETVYLENNYTYSSADSEKNIKYVSIPGSLTIDGQGHSIDANGQIQIFRIYLDGNHDIILKNIIFLNGKASNGGAIYWAPDGGNGKIINCTFINNEANGQYGGGAVNAYAGLTNIINSTFINNKAYFYGAFYESNTPCNIVNCTFMDNQVNYDPSSGIVRLKSGTISNSIFLDNSGTPISTSSATISNNWFGNTMDNFDVAPEIDGSTIDNWYVLGLDLDQSNSIVTVSLKLYENGAYADKYTLPSNIKFTIKGNGVDLDEAFYLNDTGEKSFTHTFADGYDVTVSYKNVNLTKGVSPSLSSLNSLFNGIEDEIFLKKDYEYSPILDSSFEKCDLTKTLTIDGQGHFIDLKGQSKLFNLNDESNTKNLVLKNIRFLNANGDKGAVVYFKGNKIEIINCTFEGNTALNDGDAIYIESINEASKIDQSSFINNIGTSSVVFIKSGDVQFDISNSIFLSNSGLNVKSEGSNVAAQYNWFGHNSSNYGDASIAKVDGVSLNNCLYLDIESANNVATVSLNNLNGDVYDSYLLPTIKLNVNSENATVADSIIIGVTGKEDLSYELKYYTGSLTVSYDEYSTYTKKLQFVDDGSFTALQYIISFTAENGVLNLEQDYIYNPATDSALAIGISITKPIIINGKNHKIDAQKNGRIFIVDDDATFGLIKFVNAKVASGKNGAVIYNEGGDCTFYKCSFINNTAGGSGGVIYNTPSTLTNEFQYCIFENNHANYGGVFKEGTVYCYHSIFINNTADTAGGVRDCENYNGGTDYYQNCTFINSSAIRGAVIYDSGSVTEGIYDSKFIGNMITGSNTYDTNSIIYSKVDFISGCIFINNTANTAIIYSYYSTSGDTTIMNSIFLNNNAQHIMKCNSKAIVANYNWFGNTYDNYDETPAGLTTTTLDNWLYLDAKLLSNHADFYLKLYEQSTPTIIYGYSVPEITLNINSTTLDLEKDNVTLNRSGNGRVNYVMDSESAALTISCENVKLTREFKVGDFDILQDLIDGDTELVQLERDYTYITGGDSITSGIVINKNIVIDGKGHKIDAAEKTRIFNVQSGEVTFVNITFVNGKSGDGAFIYINSDDVKINITNCTFANGASSGFGGAIYLNTKDSEFNLYDSTFTTNAAGNGGALYIVADNSNITIDKCLFRENKQTTTTGSTYGSAIYWQTTNDDDKDNVVKNSILLDNIICNGQKNNYYAFSYISGKVNIDQNWWGTTALNSPNEFYQGYVGGMTPSSWLYIDGSLTSSPVYLNDQVTLKFILRLYDPSLGICDYDNNLLPYVTFNLSSSYGTFDKPSASLNEEIIYTATSLGESSITFSEFNNNGFDFKFETRAHSILTLLVDNPLTMYCGQKLYFSEIANISSVIKSYIKASSSNESIVGVGGVNDYKYLETNGNVGSELITFYYDGTRAQYYDITSVNLVVNVIKIPMEIVVTNIENDEVSIFATDSMKLNISLIVDDIHEGFAKNQWSSLTYTYKQDDGNGNIFYTKNSDFTVNGASVNGTFTCSASQLGTSNLTLSIKSYYYDGEDVTIKFTVIKKPTAIELNHADTLEFKVDDNSKINATLINGTVDAQLKYKSSNTNVVTVDENTGELSAVGGGVAIITVKYDGNAQRNESTKEVTITVDRYDAAIELTSPKTIEIKVGDESQITATLTGEDGANLGTPTYLSSNESIVTVDSNGLITAVGGGEANITVSYAGNDRYDVAEDVNVTVKVNKLPTIITVNPATDVDVDASKSLGATVDNGRALHYVSLNPDIVSVDENTGEITGIIGGTGVINVTFAEDAQYLANHTTVTVTVHKINSEITLDPIEINVFESKLISPTIVGDGVVSYVSCDPAIVTVNATTGNITGVKGGKANVTVRVAEGAKYLAKDVNVTVTVKKLPTTIDVNPTISVDVDGTNTIVASADHGRALEFVSLDESIVTVDSATGMITGITGGKANVTVKFHEDDQYLSKEVNVTVTVNKLTPTITVGPISIDVFESKFINPDIENGGTVTYESCNSSIVTVDESTGEITGVIGGKVNVTIKVAETPRSIAKDVNVTVTVNKLPTIITVGSTMRLKIGDSDTIVASVTTGMDIHYQTDSNLITVDDATGLVTAIKGGIAEVRVSVGGTDKYKENSTIVTVTVTRLPDDDTPIPLSVFSKADVSNLYDFGDTNNLEYLSSNETVFTVSVTGSLEALAGGEANLTITDKNIGESVTIKVIVNKLATPMDVTPSITLNVYQDESIDVTIPDRADRNQLHYESSNPDVLAVDVNGKITGVTGGTATITITYVEDGQFLENSTQVQVTVKKLPTSISINETEFTLYVDGIGIINATTNNEGGLYYASTSPSIILANNVVTGVSEGVAEIKVLALENEKYLANSAIVTVNVKKIPSTITAKTKEFTIDVDGNATIGAVLDHEGTLTYKYNESIVIVENGAIFALIGGETNITISYAGDDKYAAAEDVNVSVTVNKISKEIDVNSTIEVDVDRQNAIAADADGRTLEFIGLDETVVTVDENGKITGVKAGVANVTVKCSENDKYFANEANVTVTVNRLPVTIRVNPTLNVTYGISNPIRASAEDHVLEYISLNPEIVTVDKDTGLITPVKAGVTNVTVKCRDDDKYLGEVNVTVTVIGLPITLLIEEANDATVGSSSTFKVSLRNSTDSTLITDASGFVIVYVNGTDYPINISETDHVDVVLDNMGSYDIIAVYQGDDKYQTAESNPETVKGLPKHENAIDVVVTPNIKTGDKVEINATSGSGAIEIYVDGENQTVIDGRAIIDSLSVGEHTIKVISPETALYVANSTERTVNVGKKQAEINISVEGDMIVDSIIKINIVNTGSNIVVYMDGKVIDDYKEPFKATSGNHLIVATVSEDENYLGNSESYNFTVSKKSSQIYVAGTSVTVGEATTIEVMDLPSDATGIVIIDLNGTKYSINITESKTLDVVLENPGIYDVSAIYLGDERYLSNESEVNTILAEDKKATIIDEIDLPDTIAVGDTITVDVSSNNDKLEVLFDGVRKEIVAGKLTIENVTAGNHKIDVVALETKEFKANSTSKSFDVAKKEAKVYVTLPENITLGQDIEISVTSYDGADISVYVDGEKQTLEDGKLTVKATVGSHTIIATVDETDEYLADMSNKTFAVDRFEPQMSVSGLNITEGQKTTISIETPLDEGIVNVKVGDVETLVDLSKSKTVEIQLDTPKDYEVTASFLGNDNYKPVEAKTIINVARKETPDVNIGNMGDANQTNINVDLPLDAAGSLTVTVDGDKNYTADVVNGSASVDIPDLSAGNHSITVSYSGDEKYGPTNKTTIVDVPKVAIPENSTEISMEIPEGTTSPVVEVKLPSDATGNVTVTVDGDKNYTADVVNGTASLSLDELSVGNHNVTVAYSGDDKYSPAVKDATVDVPKADIPENATKIEVDIPEESVTPEINVTLPGDATGNVTVTVDGNKSYTVPVINGTANFKDLNLTPGEHNITVAYAGDEKYSSDVKNSTVSVPKVEIPEDDSQVTINIPEGTNSPEFNVTLPGDATGNVTVTVDGNKSYTVPVVNGTATVTASNLTTGSHDVVVSYSGDSKYSSVTKNMTVDVAKVDIPKEDIKLSIEFEDNEKSAIVNVMLPSDATGYIVINNSGQCLYNDLNKGFTSINLGELPYGSHNINIIYSGNDKYNKVVKDATIVIPTPVLTADNVTILYSHLYGYKILVTFNGKPVVGKYVTFTFKGKVYKRLTDKDGYATLKIGSARFKVGTYNIISQYDGVSVTNKVQIKNIIAAKNFVAKKSNGIKIKIQLIKVNNKYLKNKNVKIKFYGKTYDVITNKYGVATLKVKSNVVNNLKVGKKYVYTVFFGKDVVSKKIKIKK